jgi:virginiamycin B lyase
MMRIKTLLIATVCCYMQAPLPLRADTVDIREWLVPWEDTEPGSPYVDDGGRVWFASRSGNYIANLAPESGQFNRYDLQVGVGPLNLIVDADTNVWFTANKGHHIGMLKPATGRVTRIEMPHRKARDPHSLAFDTAGNIWFTVQQGNFIGRLRTPGDAIDLVALPTRKTLPGPIEVSVAGDIWVAGFGRNLLLRVDVATLAVEEIQLPREKSRPSAVTGTTDGAIWYTDHALGLLGRYDPDDGVFTEWPLPGGQDSEPFALVGDRNDRLWIVETGRSPNRLVGFDTGSRSFLTQTDIPSGAGLVQSLHYFEPAGEVWFGTDTNYIGRARVH